MNYDITKTSAPKMPNLGNGTGCIKILLSQVSKDIQEPLVPMLFPILGAHISGAEFQYPDLTWKELCGQMANLVADSGGNKGQLTTLAKAICRDFRLHDEAVCTRGSVPLCTPARPSRPARSVPSWNSWVSRKKSSEIARYRQVSHERQREMLYLCRIKEQARSSMTESPKQTGRKLGANDPKARGKLENLLLTL